MENTKVQSTEAAPQQSAPEQEKKRVSDIHVPDQNAALNVMVGFLNVAQQRGVYSVEESAKIWECMQFSCHQVPLIKVNNKANFQR